MSFRPMEGIETGENESIIPADQYMNHARLNPSTGLFEIDVQNVAQVQNAQTQSLDNIEFYLVDSDSVTYLHTMQVSTTAKSVHEMVQNIDVSYSQNLAPIAVDREENENKPPSIMAGNLHQPWEQNKNVQKQPLGRVLQDTAQNTVDRRAPVQKLGSQSVPALSPSTSSTAFQSQSVSTVLPSTRQLGYTAQASTLPLKNMRFVMSGKMDKEQLQERIEALGGKVDNFVDPWTTALISDRETLKQGRSKVSDAELHCVVVVEANFLNGIAEKGVMTRLKQCAISTWGITKLQQPVSPSLGQSSHQAVNSSWGQFNQQSATSPVPGTSKTARKSTGKTKSKSADPGSGGHVRLKMKNGTFVDPDSGLEDVAHVLKVGSIVFSVVLGNVNIQSGRNNYFKMQVLKHDFKNRWWLFRSSGKIGRKGTAKVEEKGDADAAISEFQSLFSEKTGYRWVDRKSMSKLPGKMYPMDLDFGDTKDAELSASAATTTRSRLPKQVQNIIKMIFDIEQMKRVMTEFEIDLTRMPLGKISKAQICKAYVVLNEVESLLNFKSAQHIQFVDASNRFFTLIPHDFGSNVPPVLNTRLLVNKYMRMLDSLLDIEVAYHLLSDRQVVKDQDPVDAHYEKLNTEIILVDRRNGEYKMIEEYVQNTHGATHVDYDLEIANLFRINRCGEDERFAAFKGLGNRRLLWHGSRITNFAGILSQGLRIAPPEAPSSGYMFGKGIYFADMVSKSAQYCHVSGRQRTGLMLLCEVALGNMLEKTDAQFITTLPAGYHSTKGVGWAQPDPAHYRNIDDGVMVPLGKGIYDPDKRTSLNYNEYIVYNTAQVKTRYLVEIKFKK